MPTFKDLSPLFRLESKQVYARHEVIPGVTGRCERRRISGALRVTSDDRGLPDHEEGQRSEKQTCHHYDVNRERLPPVTTPAFRHLPAVIDEI